MTSVAQPVPAPTGRFRERARHGGTALQRGDLAVISFCALTVGIFAARAGTGNPARAADPPLFIAGFALIVVAALACFLGVTRPASLPSSRVAALGIVAETLLVPPFQEPAWPLYAAGLLCATAPLLRSRRLAWSVLALATLVIGGAAMTIWTWGRAPIDVFNEAQVSTNLLLHGQNPYVHAFTVLLGWKGHVPIFGHAPYDYGPAVLLLSIPARLLGDVRLTVAILSVGVVAAILFLAHRHRVARNGPTLVALLVASPFLPFMVLTEWIDTFSVAAMAGWLVLRERHRPWATAVLAVGFACKPSMLLLMAPLVVWTRGARRETLYAALGAMGMVLPFAVWTGLPQFVYDTVGIFADLPARTDGYTVDGLAAVLGWSLLPGTVLTLGVALMMAVFLVRRPADMGAALLAGSGLVVAVCLFGKQAFVNYYYIAAVGLLLSIASGAARLPDLLTVSLPASRPRWIAKVRPPVAGSTAPSDGSAQAPTQPAPVTGAIG